MTTEQQYCKKLNNKDLIKHTLGIINESLSDINYISTGNLAHHKESIKWKLEVLQINIKEINRRLR